MVFGCQPGDGNFTEADRTANSLLANDIFAVNRAIFPYRGNSGNRLRLERSKGSRSKELTPKYRCADLCGHVKFEAAGQEGTI
jgi:hypothetical protein